MAGPSSFGDQDAVQGLQSLEQSQLLDAIDRVRRENVDADMNIPQIIVCGDQSSGKSSVLEAIAQIRFPIGNQAVTKFPIEVILRHAPDSNIKVRLHPSHDRSQSQQEQIRRFRPTFDVTGSHFKDVVQEAKTHLQAVDPNRRFWSDWLSAEVSGPTQPHLTLVDLPGLIHFSEQGANGQDVEKIREATCKYLENKRAIILAVVNAVNDTANQQILSLVEQTGNAKQRTMGVLTKPDEIRRGSEKERSVLSLARNQDIHFGLGWHVLRNIGHDERDVDQSRRDEIEQTFFSSGAWSVLSRDDVGIGSLRAKLSQSLLTCIKKDLPKLVSEMQGKVKICSKELSELGESRNSVGQQKEYLVKVLGHLQRIFEAALDGQYRKAELMAFFNGSNRRQLRDVINRLSEEYAKDLRLNGKQFHVYDEDDEKDERFPEFPRNSSPLFNQPYMTNPTEVQPMTIRLKRYSRALAKHMTGRRGTNLRSHPSEAVPDIFRQQSVFWESITRKHIDRCYSASAEFISMAVLHVAGRHTGDKIMRYHINPAFDMKSDVLHEKVTDLLWPYQRSHPITYNPNFEKSTSEKHNRYIIDWMSIGDDKNAIFSAMEAIDQADSYYGASATVAVDNLVDNVATLAVERWLLHDMPNLMPPRIVQTMSDDEVSRIATEPEESKSRRTKLADQLSALQGALRTCRRHAGHEDLSDTNDFGEETPKEGSDSDAYTEEAMDDNGRRGVDASDRKLRNANTRIQNNGKQQTNRVRPSSSRNRDQPSSGGSFDGSAFGTTQPPTEGTEAARSTTIGSFNFGNLQQQGGAAFGASGQYHFGGSAARPGPSTVAFPESTPVRPTSSTGPGPRSGNNTPGTRGLPFGGASARGH